MNGSRRTSSPRPASAPEPFLELDENRLALTAARRLFALPPDAAGPPLVFVHGPPGVGKSHLVRHVLREALRGDRKLSYELTNAAELAERLRDEAVDAAQRLDKPRFLICEDVGCWGNWPELQATLVGWFERWQAAGSRLLVTATQTPGKLTGLTPRLKSRLRGGVLAGLRPPELESRVRLIEHFSHTAQSPFSREAVQALARRLSGTPLELHQHVEALAARSRAEQRPIDADLVAQVLRMKDEPASIGMERVVQLVAAEFGLTAAELRSRSRSHALVLPRQCAMLLSRELTGQPLERIGTYFGRNRTTVAHGCQRLQEQLPHLPQVRQQLARLRRTLAGDCGQPVGS